MLFRASLLLLSLGLTSCLRVSFASVNDQTPIPATEHEAIQPGVSDLEDVLDTIGAPHLVLDSLTGNDDIVLAWIWSETDTWGLQFSAGFFSQWARTGRVRFDSTDGAFQGVVVIRGQDRAVRSIRRGSLVDLIGNGDASSVRSLLRTFLL